MCWSISRRLSSALFYLPTKNKAAKRTRVYGALSGAERRRSALTMTWAAISALLSTNANPVFVRLTAEGVPAHGSTPWDGLDANEMLMRTIAGLRRFYPYFDINSGKPATPGLIPCMRRASAVAMFPTSFPGGRRRCWIIRLTETSTVEDLAKNLREACAPGVSYEIVSASTPVVMSEDNPQILAYKRLAEQVTGRKIVFEQIGGATDARLFAEKGATVIMHSGTGEGMHADGEYVVWQSVEELARIQIEYLKVWRMLKAEEIPGSGKGRKRRQNRCFPFAADGGGSCGRRGNLLRFRRRAGICRGVI